MSKFKEREMRFEVAFSFAERNRAQIRAVAGLVADALGIDEDDRGNGTVFFDEWFEDELGGDDADVEIQRIYEKESLLVIADVSDDYAGRPWCQVEARAIRALRMTLDTAGNSAQRRRIAYIRFDDGEVAGVARNAIVWDSRKKTEQELAELIVRRVSKIRSGWASNHIHPTKVEETGKAESMASVEPIIRFIHLPTNDVRYARRERELKWLNDLAKTPKVRIAAVVGMGGLGKTSLVGHWIQKHHRWECSAFRGVLFYSFYSNRDPNVFFETFLKFVCAVENLPSFPKDTPLHYLAANACRKWNYLVALDGLEILKQDEESEEYGRITNGELNEFITSVGEGNSSLLVLTSRFPFKSIADDFPKAFRDLELPLLSNEEGADLLAICGLTAPRRNLIKYNDILGGHPLALRIFAGACQEHPLENPEKVSKTILSGHESENAADQEQANLDLDEAQKRKQRRQFYKLLSWFQQKLSPQKRALLQLVALFRDPVPTVTLNQLATKMDAIKAEFSDCSGSSVVTLLHQLSEQFLLQKESSQAGDALLWTTHPIIRDVFRETALTIDKDVPKQFANVVSGKENGQAKTVEEVQSVVEALGVLLEIGEFEEADRLFRSRLEDGRCFRWVPSPQEGVRCIRGFLEPMERRHEIANVLGQERLSVYLDEMALCKTLLGLVDAAEPLFEESIKLAGKASFADVTVRLLNISTIKTAKGNLRKAIQVASEARFFAELDESGRKRKTGRSGVLKYHIPRQINDAKFDFAINVRIPLEINSRTSRANALSLAGYLVDASRDFTVADCCNREYDTNYDGIYSDAGVHWARHRMRLGEVEAAIGLVEANLAICESNGWTTSLIRCQLLAAELQLCEGHLLAAARQIESVMRVVREAKQEIDLLDALLAMARVKRASQCEERLLSKKDTIQMALFDGGNPALGLCDESFRLAARSGLLLKKCDALNLRATLLRETRQFHRALADAREANKIAVQCSYYWGLQESLSQLSEIARDLNNGAEAVEWEKEKRRLEDRMKPQIVEALSINVAYDASL